MCLSELENTHRTGWSKLGRWRPEDKTIGFNDSKGPVVFHRVVVCTAIDQYYYQSINILSNIIKYCQYIEIFCNVSIYFKAQHILVAPMRVLWEGTCCTDTDIGIHWYCWISEDQKAPVVQNNVRQPELITGHLKSAKVTVSLVLISMSSIKILNFFAGWNE